MSLGSMAEVTDWGEPMLSGYLSLKSVSGLEHVYN